MSETAPSLVPPQRAAFATEWSGSAAAAQAAVPVPEGAALSGSCELRAAPAPGNPMPPERGLEVAQLGPAPWC